MKLNFTFSFSIVLISVFFGSCASVGSKTHDNVRDLISLPAPTGPYLVGLKKYHFKDSNRKDPYLLGKEAREIMVSLYYPAHGSSKSEEVPYLESKVLKYYKDEVMPKSGLKGETLEQISTGVLKEPQFSVVKKVYPVIVFSPGNGMVPEFYLSIIRELVSQGFVVAAINHTYNSQISVFSDGSVQLRSPIGNEFFENLRMNGEDAEGALIKNHSDDISLTLEALHKIDHSGHLNFSKIGMLGHSLGGMAVTHACPHSSECQAGINMDGPLLGSRSSLLREGNLDGDLSKPFLFLTGKMIASISPKRTDSHYCNKDVIDALFKLDSTISLEEYYQFAKDRTQGRILKALNKMGKNANLIAFNTADHMSFSDWNLFSSSTLKSQEKLELLQLMKQLNIVLTNFFKRHLDSKSTQLLSGLEDQKNIRINTFE